MKILIIQQKKIGDVLTSSILFEALKEKYPQAELHYLVNSNTLPVIEHNPFIDECVFFTPEIENSIVKLVTLIRQIRQNEYEIIIDVYSKLSSNLISVFSRARLKISYYKKYTSFIYTHNIKRKKHISHVNGIEILNRLALLRPLDIDIESIKPKIYLTDKEIENAKMYLIKSNINLELPLFMISALGSTENKTYPLPYIVKIINAIVNTTKAQIIFNYMPSQLSEAELIYESCNQDTRKHIHFEVFGKNLRAFLAITKHCKALIGNEGGATNMAKALDVPTFSIFSPWIDKEGWNMFEDEKTHVSTHLKDYKPGLYNEKSLKKSKKNADFLYQNFLPEHIIPKLNRYLKNL